MTESLKSIAVFGGTFDPIHLGHLKAMCTTQKKLQFNKLLIIPSKIPPHRDQPDANTKQRLAMVKLAISTHPNLHLDLREILNNGKSYTVRTLRSLRKEYGSKISLSIIMGADAFRYFLKWYKWQEILKLANIVVTNRPPQNWTLNSELKKLLKSCQVFNAEQLKQNSYGKILLLRINPRNISSTTIRQAIKNGQSAAKFLPPAAWKYIQDKKIYR